MRISDWSSDVCSSDLSPTSSQRTSFAIRWCSASSRPTSPSRIASRRPASVPRRTPAMIELDLQFASTGAAPALADLQRWCELALRQRSGDRSDDHTSELQSLLRIAYAVFCLIHNSDGDDDI